MTLRYPDLMDGPPMVCVECQEEKGREWFALRNPTTLQKACKPCHRRRMARYQKTWAKAHPDKARAGIDKRRMALVGVPFEEFPRSEIYDRDSGQCWWCRGGLDPNNWHLDHLIPIVSKFTKLADHPGHVRHNVVASHPHCNLSRLNRSDDWDSVRKLLALYGRTETDLKARPTSFFAMGMASADDDPEGTY